LCCSLLGRIGQSSRKGQFFAIAEIRKEKEERKKERKKEEK
jgi:hypothetical protein